MVSVLHNRFSFGSWVDTLPMQDKYDISFGYPPRPQEMKRIGEDILNAQHNQLSILSSINSVSQITLNEAWYHHQAQHQSIMRLKDSVVDSLNFIESSLGGHLDGIRTVLASLDSKMAMMLNIMQNPLGTKSAELYQSGCTALSRGYLKEAKKSFKTALAHKPSDHVVLNMMGLVCLAEGEIDQAIESFKQAVAYIPINESNCNQSKALENLARAYYVKGDYANAYKSATEAYNILPDRMVNSEYNRSVYAWLSDNEASSEVLTKTLCAKHPYLFLKYLTDPDLVSVRVKLIRILDDIAEKAYKSAQQARLRIQNTLEPKLNNLRNQYSQYSDMYIQPLLQCLWKAHAYVDKEAYSMSRKALDIYETITEISDELDEFLCTFKTYDEEKERHENLKNKFMIVKNEYLTEKKEFDSKSEKDYESLENKVRNIKKNTYWILGVGSTIYILVTLIVWIANSRDIIEVILAIILLPILGIMVAIMIYGIAFVIGFFVIGFVSNSSKIRKYQIKKRKFKKDYPSKLEKQFQTSEIRIKSLEEELFGIKKRFSIYLADCNSILKG